MLIKTITGLKWSLRSLVGKNPSLFYLIYESIYKVTPKHYPKFVNSETDIVIEGFQRSANTFAVKALQAAQPDYLNIAYQLHAPAQIIRAAKWGIPTLVLIRNPQDAVASFVAKWSNISVSQALKIYINFYKNILDYKSNYVIGKFEDVTQNYAQVIQEVNNKFATDFVVPFADKAKADKFLKQWHSKPRGSFSKQSGSTKKAKIMQEIKQDKHKKLLTEAEAIYQEFIS